MSHPNQRSFVQACASLLSTTYPDARILEIGSYDVNGSVRPFFSFAREYVGIDLVPGPSVDVVGQGHDFGDSNSYDIVLSCEAFEHNPMWLETFINMIRVCRPGGAVIFTCATTGRLEHGTVRALSHASPGTFADGSNYYRNLSRKDFVRRL